MTMWTNDFTYVGNAMKVIREYDPDTYDAMFTEDWKIYVLRTGYEVPERGFSPGLLSYVLNGQDGTVAITGSDDNDPSYAATALETLVSAPLIRLGAEYIRVPVAVMLAVTLVHEFSHTRNQPGREGESPAFDAELVFILKLPEHWSERLYPEIVRDKSAEVADTGDMSQVITI